MVGTKLVIKEVEKHDQVEITSKSDTPSRDRRSLCRGRSRLRIDIEDRVDGHASSGTVRRVAELDSVRHGVVVETELAIKD